MGNKTGPDQRLRSDAEWNASVNEALEKASEDANRPAGNAKAIRRVLEEPVGGVPSKEVRLAELPYEGKDIVGDVGVQLEEDDE